MGSQTPGIGGNAPSGTSASDVGLDPNDFPALGSTAPTTSSNSAPSGGGNTAPTTSYASQAGGLPIGSSAVGAATSSASSGAPQRDFTADDFPALGGQHSADAPQPPGLNGFQNADHAQHQHRQSLLGSLGGGGGSASLLSSGMLNLPQTRNVHPGFQQSEADKQQRVRLIFSYLTRTLS